MNVLATSLIVALVLAWFLLHFVAYTMALVPAKVETGQRDYAVVRKIN